METRKDRIIGTIKNCIYNSINLDPIMNVFKSNAILHNSFIKRFNEILTDYLNKDNEDYINKLLKKVQELSNDLLDRDNRIIELNNKLSNLTIKHQQNIDYNSELINIKNETINDNILLKKTIKETQLKIEDIINKNSELINVNNNNVKEITKLKSVITENKYLLENYENTKIKLQEDIKFKEEKIKTIEKEKDNYILYVKTKDNTINEYEINNTKLQSEINNLIKVI